MFLSSATLLAAAALFPQASAAQSDLPSLFHPASLNGPGLDAGLPIELQRRLVTLDFQALRAENEGGSRFLELELFDGVYSVLRTERSSVDGGYIWRGQIQGEERSEVLISVVGESAHATILKDDELYRIAPAEVGPVHYLAQLDPAAEPECGTDASHRVFGESLSGQGNGSRNPVIDIMVVYTTAARNGAGGTNGMNSLINLAFTESNDAYANSDVTQRLNKAHSYELAGYNETGNFSTELSRLRAKNDGYMDDVHANRDQYAADCVAMIVNGSQYCGIAYLMSNLSAGFQSNAFSVTARVCATGYYSFGHELGHNMGSTHDRANGSGGCFNYSFGWRTSNNQFRTIMAYSPGTRIKYFSNPNKKRNGMPLGKANTDENYRSLNNTAQVVSDWRQGGGSGYDLDLVLNGALVAGSTGSATISGSAWGFTVYLYNGSGAGSTTIPGLGVDLEIANARKVAQKNANSAGVADISKSLPASLSGRTVYLQAADELSQISQVVTATIL
jgi:peptidyl-Asp metalloendopeptidase